MLLLVKYLSFPLLRIHISNVQKLTEVALSKREKKQKRTFVIEEPIQSVGGVC